MAVNLFTSRSLAKENGYIHIYFHVFSDQIITLFLVPMTLCVNHGCDFFSTATGWNPFLEGPVQLIINQLINLLATSYKLQGPFSVGITALDFLSLSGRLAGALQC